MTEGITVKEILEKSNAVYHQSIDAEQLTRAQKDVQSAVKNPYINQHNSKQAQGLLTRLWAKVLFCEWVECGFSTEHYNVLCIKTNELIKSTDFELYPNTATFLNNIVAYVSTVQVIADAVYATSKTVLDDAGHGIFLKSRDAEQAEQSFQALQERITELTPLFDSFGKVKMPDCRKKLLSLIKERSSWLQDAKLELEERLYGAEYNAAIVRYADLFQHYNYSSGVLNRKELTAPVKVVSTPFEDEFAFSVAEYKKCYSKSVIELDGKKIAAFSANAEQYAINLWRQEPTCIAVYGLLDTNEAGVKKVLDFLCRATQFGAESIIMDSSGEGSVLQDALKANQSISTRIFLRMPDFLEVRDLFSRLNMLSDQTISDALKKTCGFMGYVGVNEAINIFCALQNDDWLTASQLRSEHNRLTAKEYLSKLSDPIQLLDSGWETNEEIPNHENEGRKPFHYDYDAYKVLKPQNLELILTDQKLPLKAKCGMAVKYCLLYGDDLSVWASLEKEDVQRRITDACRVLARILDTAYDPEVLVLDKLDVAGAAALCCNGGKTIQFKAQYTKEFEFLADSVLHEMFHSFQHTACDCGWRNWHLSELQTSRRRVEEWAKNFAVYQELKKGESAYRCQSVETDTRIFAKEAWDDAASHWHALSQKFD